MITQEQANRFHKVARMIELDGAEGYFSCCERFGSDVAGMALIMWSRCKLQGSDDKYPSLEVHQELMEETNKILVEAGRMVN
jgi:hypothetical protein